jgi:endonuclease/exonuclease/phosphatase family metal-dependent hydrolase
MSIKILTFNIHKGFNWNNSELTIQRLKKSLETIHPDIVFLQEVVGENKKYEKKFEHWVSNQFEFLAKDLWKDFIYSNHAKYDHRHHGNVILSKFPIISSEVQDISLNKYEQRSILFSQISIEGKIVHAFCVHLNLLHRDRVQQYEKIKEYINNKTDLSHPILLSGDFNDWNQKASSNLLSIDGLHDAYKSKHGFYAKTFPAIFPLMKLDRIYTKDFQVHTAEVLAGDDWKTLSDHLPIYIEVDLK